MRHVYVICNRADPLAVFDEMDEAFIHARKFSNDWLQPLRVFEVDHPTGQALTVPPRIVGMFKEGKQIKVSVRAQA